MGNGVVRVGNQIHPTVPVMLVFRDVARKNVRIRDLLPTNTLINVYNSLFMSFLQYGIIVWGQTSASYIDPIFKLQKEL